MAHHTSAGMKAKKKLTKIASITLAGILVASVVAISVSISNSNPFLSQPTVVADPHDPRVLVMHSHVLLEITAGGNKVVVPANIGIDPRFYNDHTLDKHAAKPELAPIHTHNGDGLIHIESIALHEYTMGDFLNIWGFDPSEMRTISMTVDGEVIPDYKNHVLIDGQQITLKIS